MPLESTEEMAGDMMAADGTPMRRKKSKIKIGYVKKDDSGVELIEPTQTMVNEWFELTDDHKYTIIRTWKAAWPFRREICHELALLAEPFGADPETDTMNGFSLQVIMDTYNACVGFIKIDMKEKQKLQKTEDMTDSEEEEETAADKDDDGIAEEEDFEGEEVDYEDDDLESEEEEEESDQKPVKIPNMKDAPAEDAEFSSPEKSPSNRNKNNENKNKDSTRPADAVKDASFFGIVKHLSRIAALHRAKGIDPANVLATRAWLIHCFKKFLGGMFTDEVREAWLALSSVVVLTLITDSVASLGPKPTKRDVWVVTQTWHVVEQSQERGDALFLQELFALSNEAKEVLEGRNFPLVSAFSKVVHQANQPRTFQTMLEKLGARHYEFNVKPGLFKPAKKAMWAMLAEILGVMWDDQAVMSWNKVWNYTTRIMASALRQTWMIHLPPEPCVVRLSVKIKHLKNIDPIGLCFFSELEYDCWDGNIPSRAFAFDKGETKDIDAPWEVLLTNGESIINSFEQDRLPKAAKVSKNFWHRRHARGKFSQFFDLHDYPFDAHSLRIYFEMTVPHEEAHFNQEKGGITISFERDASLYGVGGAEWDVYKAQHTVRKVKRGRQKRHEQVVVSLPITRRYHNFLYQVLGPLFLIDVVGFLSYFVEHKPTFYRFSVLAPLLLTMFSFKWTLSKQIPPVPYLTKFDRFFNQSYVFFLVHTTMTVTIKLFDRIDHHYHTVYFLGSLGLALVCCAYFRITLLTECLRIAKDHAAELADESGKKKLLNTEDKLLRHNYEDPDEDVTMSFGSSSCSMSNSQSNTGGSILDSTGAQL